MGLIWNKTASGICDALNWDKESIEAIKEDLERILEKWEEEEENYDN